MGESWEKIGERTHAVRKAERIARREMGGVVVVDSTYFQKHADTFGQTGLLAC